MTIKGSLILQAINIFFPILKKDTFIFNFPLSVSGLKYRENRIRGAEVVLIVMK